MSRAPPALAGGLLPAIAEAHRLIDAAASAARRQALAAEVQRRLPGRTRAGPPPTTRTPIAGIERRLATAPAERRAVLEQRLRSTREEQARRLAEIAEKYPARHGSAPTGCT